MCLRSSLACLREILYQPPTPNVAVSLAGSSNGTSKLLYWITKAAVRQQKQETAGKNPNFLPFSLMRLPVSYQSSQMWHIWTPYSNPQEPLSVQFSRLSQCSKFSDGLVIQEKQRGLLLERNQAGQSWRLLCNTSQANYNEKRGRKACQRRRPWSETSA